MNADELLTYYAAFSRLMLSDPALSLAFTASVFDPLGVYYEHDLLHEAEEPHPALVLMIARQAFPDLYTEACEQMLAGTDIEAIANHAADHISAEMGGLETYSWEDFYWGISMPAYGIDWEETDTNTRYARLLALFDRTSASDLDDLDGHAARLVSDSLPGHPRWRYVAHLLDQFFSRTGNTCVDFTWEAMAEIQPLFWQPDHIEFAQAIITEAHELLESAEQGLTLLDNHTIFHVLRSNIRWLRQKLENLTHPQESDYARYRRISDHPIDIEWPDPF
jgi:hypothetical protein